MAIKQSVSWWCFAGRGVCDAVLLQNIQSIGYEAVELIDVALFQQARECGLVIATHQGHKTIDQGLNDLNEHPRIEDELHRSLALAQKYEIPNLVVFSGNRRPGLSEEEGLANTAIGLTRVVKAAEDAGVTLILELLNSKRDHRGYQCDSTAWGVEVCRLAASSRVKLLYDIYHMQIMEGDLIDTIGENHKDFAHYHTAGVPGRNDLDTVQEINYPAVLRAIARTNYDGYVGHEFIPKSDPIAALKTAWDLCNSSLKSAG
jgi:hydroxypyruvate isomerase